MDFFPNKVTIKNSSLKIFNFILFQIASKNASSCSNFTKS